MHMQHLDRNITIIRLLFQLGTSAFHSQPQAQRNEVDSCTTT